MSFQGGTKSRQVEEAVHPPELLRRFEHPRCRTTRSAIRSSRQRFTLVEWSRQGLDRSTPGLSGGRLVKETVTCGFSLWTCPRWTSSGRPAWGRNFFCGRVAAAWFSGSDGAVLSEGFGERVS